MLQSRARPFVCRSCLSHRSLPLRVPARSRLSLPPLRSSSTSYSFVAADSLNKTPETGPSSPSSIRNRLRIWDKENPQGELASFQEALQTQHPRAGQNLTTRFESALSPGDIQEDDIVDDDGRSPQDIYQDLFDADTQPHNTVVSPGDLVYFSPSNPFLAVCIDSVDSFSHFYTSHGRWIIFQNPRFNFITRGFATEDEIADVRAVIPPPGTPSWQVQKLVEFAEGPKREVGQHLLRKIQDFVHESDGVLRRHHKKLDDPYPLLAPLGLSFITAREAAKHLLAPDEKLPDGYVFPPADVFAVQKALTSCTMGLSVIASAVFGLDSSVYKIMPIKDMHNYLAVEEMSQKLMDDIDLTATGPSAEASLAKHQLGRFILRARRRIDRSRREREFSSSKLILGPYRPPAGSEPPVAEPWLEEDDHSIMSFMQTWAATRDFSLAPRPNIIAPAILKAIGRYEDCEFIDRSLGWVFLQETGWILPWDIRSHYAYWMPGIEPSRAGGTANLPEPVPDHVLQQDCFPGERHVWKDTPIFCLDAATTHVLDDAISVERTSTPGEYWIHAHIADPASAVAHDSLAARFAEQMVMSIYLHGHYTPMFSDEILAKFSLGRGARCLTFSAKVDEGGELLDYRITPGILDCDLIPMTPEEAMKLDPNTKDLEATCTLLVGPQAPATPQPERRMKGLDELSAREAEDLKLLVQLTSAVKGRLTRNSGLPWLNREPTDVPYLDLTHAKFEQASDGTFTTAGDSVLKIMRESKDRGATVVQFSMILAGEVAGRWCADRQIPAPYWTTPHTEANKDIIRKLLDKRTDEAGFFFIPGEERGLVQNLFGFATISPEPGNHMFLGTDHYCKATSPLRRYTDVILHWQIHAALAKEARRGDGGKPPVLPFDRTNMEEMVKMLMVRTRFAKNLNPGQGVARREMMHVAVGRALFNGEADRPLPETFRLRITGKKKGRRVHGALLDLMDMHAVVLPDGLNGIWPSVSQMLVGDEYDVRITHVDPGLAHIFVELVRLHKSAPHRLGELPEVSEDGLEARRKGVSISANVTAK